MLFEFFSIMTVKLPGTNLVIFTVIHLVTSYHLHTINYVKITIASVFLPNLLKLKPENSIIPSLTVVNIKKSIKH